MGQWGLGDGLELLSLLHHWQTQTQSNTRLLVKVFEPNPINDYELKLLWDQSQSLISTPHLQPIANAILKAKPARIIGCQRLIFDDGRITVDLHFGDLHTSLTNLPHSPAHPIQQWLVLPHLASQLSGKLAWQMARLSADDAQLIGVNLAETVQQLAHSSGFSTLNVSQDALNGDASDALPSQIITDEILLQDRKSVV